MSDWQPIATAPKMRTVILYADYAHDGGSERNGKMGSGFWHTGYEDDPAWSPWYWGDQQLRPYDLQPTHWQPLPEPPAKGV